MSSEAMGGLIMRGEDSPRFGHQTDCGGGGVVVVVMS